MNNYNTIKQNSTGSTRGFLLHTTFRYQTTPDLPLIEMPDNLFMSFYGSIVIITSGGNSVAGTLAGITVYTPRFTTNSEPVLEADRILTEYAQKAVPMKYTMRYLDFVGGRSKMKTGSSETESSKIGVSADIAKILSGESSGQVNLEYQKTAQTAFSYYTLCVINLL